MIKVFSESGNSYTARDINSALKAMYLAEGENAVVSHYSPVPTLSQVAFAKKQAALELSKRPAPKPVQRVAKKQEVAKPVAEADKAEAPKAEVAKEEKAPAKPKAKRGRPKKTETPAE
ncbi:MAG: hypothetical protein AAFN81_33820 [Bacteroidota bacterium]